MNRALRTRDYHTTAAIGAAVVLLLAGCNLSPLNHRIDVGEERFAVFVGEGNDRHTDIFAVGSNGGSVSQVTFTPLLERSPRLTPGGEVMAFLRMRDTLPTTPRVIVMMNLVSGSETGVTLPESEGVPELLAWDSTGTILFVRTNRGIWRVAAPPAPSTPTPVSGSQAFEADSALATWLGSPRFARAIPCPAGGACAIGAKGDTSSLTVQGHDAFAWGADSVAWFEEGTLVVRSLGPGHLRRVQWTGAPANPREGSFATPLRP